MSDSEPSNLQLANTALRLLSRANRMRVLRDALVAAEEEWIARFLPERFRRTYAQGQLGYATSQRRSRLYSGRGRYAAMDGSATSEGLTYDEKKRNLQGHDDPLVWTGRLRQQIFEQAAAKAVAVRGTEDTVRGTITFGRLAVGGPGNYRALPELIRRTLTTLPPGEISALHGWYRDHVLARLQGVDPQARRLPSPPPVLDDRRAGRDQARASALADAMSLRRDVTRYVSDRRARRRAQFEAWSQQSGGSAPLGGPSRSPEERRYDHRLRSRASYYRNHERALARRRARYRVRSSSISRGARRAAGATKE